MKKIAVMMSIIFGSSPLMAKEILSNEVGEQWSKTQTYGEKGPDGKPFAVGLEFTNAGKNPVWIKVFNDGDTSFVYQVKQAQRSFVSKDMDKRNFTIDINKPTFLAVWSSDPRGASNTNFKFPPDMFFEFTQGKTVYVTWDSSTKEGLRPTKGKVLGLLNKTDSGLNLKNNVSQKDIFARTSSVFEKQVQATSLR